MQISSPLLNNVISALCEFAVQLFSEVEQDLDQEGSLGP